MNNSLWNSFDMIGEENGGGSSNANGYALSGWIEIDCGWSENDLSSGERKERDYAYIFDFRKLNPDWRGAQTILSLILGGIGIKAVTEVMNPWNHIYWKKKF